MVIWTGRQSLAERVQRSCSGEAKENARAVLESHLRLGSLTVTRYNEIHKTDLTAPVGHGIIGPQLNIARRSYPERWRDRPCETSATISSEWLIQWWRKR